MLNFKINNNSSNKVIKFNENVISNFFLHSDLIMAIQLQY